MLKKFGKYIIQSIIVLFALSINAYAFKNIYIGNIYEYTLSSSTTTSVHAENRNAQYYTLKLNKSENVVLQVDALATSIYSIDIETGLIPQGTPPPQGHQIYLIQGDANGTVIANDTQEIRMKLSAGTYTIEIIYDSADSSNIEYEGIGTLRTFEYENPTEPKEIHINQSSSYTLDPSVVSIHQKESYAQYYTFELGEAQYLSFAAFSNSIIDAYLGLINESEIIPVSVYIINGENANGKVIASGNSGYLTTLLSAGTYMIEITTENPSMSDSGSFEIRFAPPPASIVNSIILDE